MSNAKTKLQLCQDLVDEAQGISGNGPSTTLNQTGQYKRVIRWIDTAYRDIQRKHTSWLFLRRSFEGQLSVAGGNTYTGAQLGLDDLSQWIVNENGREDDMRVYSDTVNYTDELPIAYLPWDDFRRCYMSGSSRNMTGSPQVFTVKPDNSLVVYPIPNKNYIFAGEYYRAPHVFGEEDGVDVDDDTPIFPDEYHDAVMWKGLMYYATKHAEPDVLAEAEINYKNIIREMELTQLPKPVWGPPLA